MATESGGDADQVAFAQPSSFIGLGGVTPEERSLRCRFLGCSGVLKTFVIVVVIAVIATTNVAVVEASLQRRAFTLAASCLWASFWPKAELGF